MASLCVALCGGRLHPPRPTMIARHLRLTAKQIVAWADAYRRRTGEWPTQDSGPVFGQLGQTWKAIDGALRRGRRGLLGGDSLPRLLARERGARHVRALPPLTE